MVKSKSSTTATVGEYKALQLDVILRTNPAHDDIHAWIRDISDILTFREAVDADDALEYGGAPDFTASDYKRALDTGRITVYSSYPIEQGIFVTPSKMEAQSYAGNGKVHSKDVKLTDVAWLDSMQGQYTGDLKRRLV